MVSRVSSRSWDKPILGLILNSIHQLLDLATVIWLFLNVWFRKFSRTNNNVHEDFFKLKASCSKNLTKIPNHIALAFLEPAISIPDVSKLVVWSIASGANCISLYDIKGFLKDKQLELISSLQLITKKLPRDQFNIHWHDNSGLLKSNGKDLSSSPGQIHICLLSRQDGGPDIVQAAQRLAAQVANGNLKSESLDESLLGSALTANRGLPDPDVLMRFGLAHSNLGFPPWQIRLSEIHDIDTHREVSLRDFFQVLSKFSKCEQRFGH